jgi:hypothetical protein
LLHGPTQVDAINASFFLHGPDQKLIVLSALPPIDHPRPDFRLDPVDLEFS